MRAETEIHARIQQMRDEETHGREAAALLPYLAVFRETFDGGALMAVIQSELEASPSLLLKVLRTWGLVEQRDKNHHRLTPGVAEEVTPLPQYFERHFEYYRTRHTRVDSDRYERISEAWPNIAAALMWGFEHQPDHAVEWVLVLQPYTQIHVPLPERNTLIQRAFQVVDRLTVFNRAQMTKAQGDVAFSENDLVTARQHYDAALRLYDTLPREASFWINRSNEQFFDEYIKQLHPDCAAPYVYKQSHYFSISLREAFQVFTLFDAMIVAMIQEDIRAVQDMAMRILIFCQWREENNDDGGTNERMLLDMWAQWAQRRQNLVLVRYFYGHLLHVYSWGGLGLMDMLWNWGTFEYSAGQKQDGYALCQLALHGYLDHVESNPKNTKIHDEAARLQQIFNSMTREEA